MKTILFTHHNYPAQFKPLIDIALEKDYVVFFACETAPENIDEKVHIIRIGMHKSLEKSAVTQQMDLALRARSTLWEWKNKIGLKPDVVISHSGFGQGTFIRELFPAAIIVSYIEWWFNNEALEYRYTPKTYKWLKYTDKKIDKLSLRNTCQAHELLLSDLKITPTKWQLKQLPDKMRDEVSVVYDLMPEEFFRPNLTRRSSNRFTLTYATRGLEPMRHFPEFVEICARLIEILGEEVRSCLDINIVGDDRICYGCSSLPEEGSFGNYARKHLGRYGGLVKFQGRLPLVDYARMLKKSDLHIYMSRPFVLSWSLLHAMLSGCNLVTNKIDPIEEFFNPVHKQWLDPFDVISSAEYLKDKIGRSFNRSGRKHNMDVEGLRYRKDYLDKVEKKAVLKFWNELIR